MFGPRVTLTPIGNSDQQQSVTRRLCVDVERGAERERETFFLRDKRTILPVVSSIIIRTCDPILIQRRFVLFYVVISNVHCTINLCSTYYCE